MPALADRCKDTTTTTGTGTVQVSGTPPTGFASFTTQYANNDAVPYAIVDNNAGNWEVGLGTMVSNSTGTFITRDTPFDGSSGKFTLVSFAAGSKDVFGDLPASLINDNYGIAIAMQLNWFTL